MFNFRPENKSPKENEGNGMEKKSDINILEILESLEGEEKQRMQEAIDRLFNIRNIKDLIIKVDSDLEEFEANKQVIKINGINIPVTMLPKGCKIEDLKPTTSLLTAGLFSLLTFPYRDITPIIHWSGEQEGVKIHTAQDFDSDEVNITKRPKNELIGKVVGYFVFTDHFVDSTEDLPLLHAQSGAFYEHIDQSPGVYFIENEQYEFQGDFMEEFELLEETDNAS